MKFTEKLHAPTPVSTLVFLRIALGLLGGGDMLGNGIYYHWMKGAYSDYTFAYYGFEWVKPLPDPLLSVFFIGAFFLGIAVALGWRFRITAPLFALAFSYFFLLEKAHYLNHAYLFIWLTWLLVLTPAWRAFSLDVKRRPNERATHVPAWCVYLFPALMGVVYFWGGIAKINHDWLIEAMPLHMWLQARGEMPLLGWLWEQKTTAYLMAWGGMLLDLSVPFLLLHRRLRWLALALLFVFHATNHLIFNIGIFPYLSLVLTSMWFDPDWPRKFTHLFRNPENYRGDGAQVQGEAEERGAAGGQPLFGQRAWSPSPGATRWAFSLLVIVFVVHTWLPLRHHFFASDVAWSEEGHRYSWRMMLRSKQGSGHYLLVDGETGAEETVYPRERLQPRQYRKMATHPDMILQYAHHLRDEAAAEGQDLAVYGRFRVRLNGRERQNFIDPETDLAQTEWTWWGAKEWVLPE